MTNDGCTNSCVAFASTDAIYHARVMGGKRPITLGRDKVKNRLSQKIFQRILPNFRFIDCDVTVRFVAVYVDIC